MAVFIRFKKFKLGLMDPCLFMVSRSTDYLLFLATNGPNDNVWPSNVLGINCDF